MNSILRVWRAARIQFFRRGKCEVWVRPSPGGGGEGVGYGLSRKFSKNGQKRMRQEGSVGSLEKITQKLVILKKRSKSFED